MYETQSELLAKFGPMFSQSCLIYNNKICAHLLSCPNVEAIHMNRELNGFEWISHWIWSDVHGDRSPFQPLDGFTYPNKIQTMNLIFFPFISIGK